MIDPQALQREVSAAMQKVEVKSYVILYLDGDQVKVTGTMSMSSLAPVLLDVLTKRMK